MRAVREVQNGRSLPSRRVLWGRGLLCVPVGTYRSRQEKPPKHRTCILSSLHPEYHSMRTFVMAIYAKRVTQTTEYAMQLLQGFGKIETLLLSKHAKNITEENALTHRCKNDCGNTFTTS